MCEAVVGCGVTGGDGGSIEHIELHGSANATITPGEWQARITELTRRLVEAGQQPAEVLEDLREAFAGITFVDADAKSWRHDGSTWWCWEPSGWVWQAPPAELRLDRVEFAIEPEPGPDELGFWPSHWVPEPGLPAWTEPDPTLAATTTVEAGLEVEILEYRDDGWAHVRFANDWRAWVDGRLLSDHDPH